MTKNYLLSVDVGSVELVNGGSGLSLVVHGDEGVTLLGDVHVRNGSVLGELEKIQYLYIYKWLLVLNYSEYKNITYQLLFAKSKYKHRFRRAHHPKPRPDFQEDGMSVRPGPVRLGLLKTSKVLCTVKYTHAQTC